MWNARFRRVALAVILTGLCGGGLAVRGEEEVRPDQMADLIALSMTPSPHDVVVQVRNRATHPQQGVVVALFAGTVRVAEQKTDIPPGRTVTVRLPWRAREGAGPLAVQVDPDLQLVERDRGDNLVIVRPAGPRVADVQAEDLPEGADLRIEGLSIGAAKFEEGRPRRVTVSFRIVNAGAAPVTGAFRTDVFPGTLAQDGQLATGSVTTIGIPSQGTVYVSSSVVSPVGEFDVRVEADAGRVIAEADENNNTATSHFANPDPDVGQWISIGPRRMAAGNELGSVGKLSAIAIHPAQPDTLYVGALLSGVWKTTDLGANWQPVTDSLPSLGIAGLAIDPTAPSRVYVSTDSAGVFRSEDDGVSWTSLPGSPNGEVRWGVMLVHPTNRNVLYVTSAAGVHRSRDFGATWQPVLSGIRVTDLVMDVLSPNTLYAAREGTGIQKTTDGGDTWTPLTNGLPAGGSTVGQITLAICRNAPNNLYAGFSTTTSGLQLFRTTNTGSSWTQQEVPVDSFFNDVIGVDPVDPHFAYITGVPIFRRVAGSLTFVVSSGTHIDHHALAHDFSTGALYTLNDGGIYRSTNRGATWAFIGEGILNAEFYDHAVAVTAPNLVIGGTQDNGTVRFDGNSTIWNEINDGDGATVDIDPTNAGIVVAMQQNQSSMVRIVNGARSCIGCSIPTNLSCANLHFQMHPVTPSIMLASCVHLWRSNNPTCPQCPDARTGFPGTLGVWNVIFPMTFDTGNVMHSAVDGTTDLHYVGTSIGELWAGPSGAGWARMFSADFAQPVTDIDIDPEDPAVLFVSVGGGFGDRVFRLKRLSSTPAIPTTTRQPLPGLPIGIDVRTLAVDRMIPFTIYAGTNQGVYRARSTDDGVTWTWTPYVRGMPAVTDIRDLEVHPVTGVLRAASFGRGVFEVDTDPPIDSVLGAAGKITLLRVHDLGTGFGPATDFIDTEVVIALDSLPGRFFGFQLRADSQRDARAHMFQLLREAFRQDRRVQIDYVRTGVRNGRMLRVVLLPTDPFTGGGVLQ